jgi:sugar phosphate isomerase/epimerase
LGFFEETQSMTMHRGAMTRRQFLQTGAAGALGVSLLPALLQADVASESGPYGGFAVGAQSWSFRQFDTEQMLKRTKDLGLQFVELCVKHATPDMTAEQVKALGKLCGEYGIKPRAYGVHHFSKNHDANKKAFDFGKELGLRAFSADPDPDSFDSLDKLVDEYKIAIAIHPHGPQGNHLHRWYSAEVIMAAVKDHHPLIGSCLDTGHLIRAEQLGKKLDPAAEIRTMGARNFGIHLKDHDNREKHDVVFGKGELDVPAVLKALKDVHFKGLISLEYEWHEEEPSPDMRACLVVLRQAAKGLT